MRGKTSLRKVCQKKGERDDSSQRTTQTHFKVAKPKICLQTPGGKVPTEEGSGSLDMGIWIGVRVKHIGGQGWGGGKR